MSRFIVAVQSTCFTHLGCVNITKAWYYKKCRTVNLPPQERHIVNTKFLFLSRCSNEAVRALQLPTKN